MYFATASDTEHYPWLLKLIDSIHRHNKSNVIKIAVFDLGLTVPEIEYLNSLPGVKVYELEETNPYIKQKYVIRPNGRMARGWYSWKPVVLYQALQLFPYVLYLDAGIEVKASLRLLFREIKMHGYFLFDGGQVQSMATQRVRQLYALDNPANEWILKKDGITAGIQGISRKIFNEYIVPLYELSSDIQYFEDDGTAPNGFGASRHDQALFSIRAIQLKLKTHSLYSGLVKYFDLRKHNEKDALLCQHAITYNLA